ncbi:unnamed protein product [Symbiodinium pilosum]|uniref:Uncharacterized protein n=1 Tax=Symbiodinium pilosum TaxID=2952 RepID=A0A812XTM9_SYMPI|nr:unnamed protein product [Symbiodinium pilosum]
MMESAGLEVQSMGRHLEPDADEDEVSASIGGDGAPPEHAEPTGAGDAWPLQPSTGPDGLATPDAPSLVVENSNVASPVSQHEESSAELRTELAQLRAKLEDAHGQLRQRERQLADLSNVLADMEAREVARREQTQTVRSKATEAVRAAEREMQSARRRAEQAEARSRDAQMPSDVACRYGVTQSRYHVILMH